MNEHDYIMAANLTRVREAIRMVGDFSPADPAEMDEREAALKHLQALEASTAKRLDSGDGE